jgi:hypothetical protein
MTMQTVTATFETTMSYWLQPVYAYSTTSGIESELIQSGILYGAPTSSSSLSLTLDDTFLWNVRLTGQNMPPVQWLGLSVVGGGNLFELLVTAGWVPPA